MGSRRFPWGPRTPETSVEFSFLGIHDLHAPAWVLGFGSRKRWTAPGGFLGLHIGATCHMPVNLWTFIIDFAEVEHTSLKNPSWSSWNLFQWRLVMSICIFPAIFMALNLGKNRSWTCGPSALLMCKRCHVWLGLESGRAWKGVEGCGRVWNLRFQKAHVI